MAMPNGIPPQLATLLAAQMPQQGPDAKQLAMLQALQGAQGAPAATPPIPQAGDTPSAPPTGAGYYPGEAGYMSDNSPAMKEYDNGVRYSPQSDIAAGEGTYERSPGEDKAAQMAQDAVEGKGTTYPGKSDPQTEEIDGNQIKNILSVWDEDDKTFETETDMTRDEAAALLKQYGIKPPQ